METITNLKNKPLVEAMFELRWGLNGPPGVGVDPYYQMLIGQLSAAIKNDYPQWEQLPIAEVPQALAPYAPHYRFRVAQDRWPLVQLGPGLLTMNDTEGYEWETFFPRCMQVLEALFDVYPNAHENLHIFEVTLRYIDADVLLEETPLAFLKKMHVSVDVPDALFSGGRIDGNNLGVGLLLAYPSLQPKGLFQVSFNRGQKNEQDAVIWETQVTSRGADAPRELSTLKAWLQEAHVTTHDWFMRQIEGELMEKYR